MKLLCNTILGSKNNAANYEILFTNGMLVFKPFFYHTPENKPCIILIKDGNGWEFQEPIDKLLKAQVLDDIIYLKKRYKEYIN